MAKYIKKANDILLGGSTSTGGGGGIPEPTVDGNNVRTKNGSTLSWSQTELVSTTEKGVWNGKADKPLETTINQTAAITIADFTTEEKAINGFSKTWKIVGDSVNPLTLPTTWLSKNSIIFDNTRTNYLVATNIQGQVVYEINSNRVLGSNNQNPQLISVTSSYNGQEIYATFDEIIQGTSNFALDSGSIASQSLVGNYSKIIPTSALVAGSSFSLSGGNTIKDLNNNFFAGASPPFAGVNYTANNIKSLAAGVQLTGSASKLQSATGAGGTDSPRSLGLLVFVNDPSTQQDLIWVAHIGVQLNPDRKIGAVIANGSNYVYKISNTPLNLGWNYVIITFDSSKSAAGINIDVNNVANNGSTGSLTYTGGTNSTAITIGNASTIHLVDEVHFWNKVLNTSEKTEVYNSGIVKDMRTHSYYTANNNNLLFYCKFDDSIADLSPSPLTLTGTPTYSTNIAS